jgi:hypothetical protein
LTKGKKIGLGVLFTLGFFLLIFVTGLANLGYYAFFAPKKENIRREVFEQTKSYVHGKVQELAKHYAEYQKGNADDQAALREVIRMNFASFDANNIPSPKLRQFLVNQRGF